MQIKINKEIKQKSFTVLKWFTKQGKRPVSIFCQWDHTRLFLWLRRLLSLHLASYIIKKKLCWHHVDTGILAVIAACNQALFKELTGRRSPLRLYLHDPTRYEQYLRRVLIVWFMSGTVDLSLVWVRPTQGTHVQSSLSNALSHGHGVDHTYCCTRKKTSRELPDNH